MRVLRAQGCASLAGFQDEGQPGNHQPRHAWRECRHGVRAIVPHNVARVMHHCYCLQNRMHRGQAGSVHSAHKAAQASPGPRTKINQAHQQTAHDANGEHRNARNHAAHHDARVMHNCRCLMNRVQHRSEGTVHTMREAVQLSPPPVHHANDYRVQTSGHRVHRPPPTSLQPCPQSCAPLVPRTCRFWQKTTRPYRVVKT